MNTKLIRKAKTDEEVKEIEELYDASRKFRETLTGVLEDEVEALEKKALSLMPSLLLKWRYFRLVSEINARKSLINLLK